MKTKKCNKCKETKPVEKFYRRSDSDNYRHACKECYKATQYHETLKKYNITLDCKKALLKKQSNQCAICKKFSKKHTGLCVDHCHASGEVRGLLCQECNKGIGLLKDNRTILKNAINYLKNPPNKRNNI